MKRHFRKTFSLYMAFGMLFLFLSASPPKSPKTIKGTLFDKAFETSVDSELAKLMLTHPNDSAVIQLFETYKNYPLTTQTLANIYFEYSVDVASLYFVQRIYQQPENKKIQNIYFQHIEKLHAHNDMEDLIKLKDYYLVFIPGLGYIDHPGTGANFKRQRKLMSYYGIPNEFIRTKQWGTVESNAHIIYNRLRKICAQHKKIILISSSKSGLETAIVLGQMMKPEESQNIKAWVSVSGILRGSPIADYFLTPSRTLLSKIILLTKGKSIKILQSISYRERRKSFDKLIFPEHIKIIHYVGVPMATQIRNKIKNQYMYMLPLGPNDGFTPIADQISDKGIVISEVGVDHFFDDPDIDVKSLSLALSCLDLIKTSSQSILTIEK